MSQTVEDAIDANGVDGGKVWTPTQYGNGGSFWIELAVLSIVLSTMLFLFSISFAGEYEGKMTESLWSAVISENQKLLPASLLSVVAILCFFRLPWLGGKKYLFVAVPAMVIGISAMTYLGVTKDSTTPIQDWMANEYNYELMDSNESENRFAIHLANGKSVTVKSLDDDSLKIVNAYIVDDVVYLATDEADLNKQVNEQKD